MLENGQERSVTKKRVAAMAESLQPIIIKKKIINADGHHGGAWKVAYADFVTAMMAFFLLMWLLNATTEDQRKGIADYFNPTIPLSRISGGGSAALSGDSIRTEDTLARSGTGTKGQDIPDDLEKVELAEKGEQATGEKTGTGDNAGAGENGQSAGDNAEAAEAQKLAMMEEAINGSEGALSQHMQVKMSPEGIVLEIVESDGATLFDNGNAEASETLKQLLSIVAYSFQDVENKLKIVGHTDASGYSDMASYNNWDLSTDRANTARRLLLQAGFPSSQIAEVSGKAATEPLSDDIYAPQNRRISVTILRKS